MIDYALWGKIISATAVMAIMYAYGNRERGDGDAEDNPKDAKIVRELKFNKIAVYGVYAFLFFMLSVLVFGAAAFAPWRDTGVPTVIVLTVADFLLNWLCFSFGWGKFFPHGQNYSTVDNAPVWLQKEFPPGEWLANAIHGKWMKPEPEDFVRKWQFTALCGRFLFTFSLIKFTVFGAVIGSWLLPLLSVPFSIGAATAYWFAFRPFTNVSLIHAELSAGIAFGFMHSLMWVLYGFGHFAL